MYMWGRKSSHESRLVLKKGISVLIEAEMLVEQNVQNYEDVYVCTQISGILI